MLGSTEQVSQNVRLALRLDVAAIAGSLRQSSNHDLGAIPGGFAPELHGATRPSAGMFEWSAFHLRQRIFWNLVRVQLLSR